MSMDFLFRRRLHSLLMGRGRWVVVWDWYPNSDLAQLRPSKQPHKELVETRKDRGWEEAGGIRTG